MQVTILVAAGRTIRELHSWRDLYSWQAIVVLCALTALSIAPALLQRWWPGLLGTGQVATRRRPGDRLLVRDSNRLRPSQSMPESLEAAAVGGRGAELSAHLLSPNVVGGSPTGRWYQHEGLHEP